MLLAILSICSQEELNDSDADSDDAEPESTPEDLAARRQLIKSKILAVGRMQKVFQLLRFVFLLFCLFLTFSLSIHQSWLFTIPSFSFLPRITLFLFVYCADE